jgi:hypothetical protein
MATNETTVIAKADAFWGAPMNTVTLLEVLFVYLLGMTSGACSMGSQIGDSDRSREDSAGIGETCPLTFERRRGGICDDSALPEKPQSRTESGAPHSRTRGWGL